MNQLEGDTTSYNISKAFKIKGDLDIKRLEEIFRIIISRHDTLRTSFCIQDGVVVQKVSKNVDFNVDYYECENQGIDKIIKEYIRPFNLETAPLLRLAVIRCNSDEFVMLFDIHHIIADGYSLDVLIKEVVTLYEGHELPKLKMQYKDFVTWQKNFLNTDYVKKQEEYWLKVFEKEFKPLELPTEYTRPAVQDYTGDEYLVNLDKKVVDKIKNMAVFYKTTPFVIMLSCYNILLAKYTHQNDIIVGIPVVGRPNHDLTALVGMFVNTLALRNEVKKDMSFEDFLLQVKDKCNAAYENQDYQFDSLVNKISKGRDLSRNSILNTIFNMNNIRNAEVKMQNLILEDYDMTSSACTTDILFHCIESGDGMILGFRYQISLFSREYIQNFADSYCYILEQMNERANVLISDIKLLTQAEEKRILSQFSKSNDVKLKNETLLTLFQDLVTQKNEAFGRLKDDRNTYNYRQIDRLSDSLALKISEGTQDKIIGVVVQPSVNFVIAVLAIWKAKAAFLPIAPDTPKERIKFIMSDTKTNTVIIDNSVDISDLGYHMINLEEDMNEEQCNYPQKEICPSDIAYIIYTSGTTGTPKGVMISHENIYNYVQWAIKMTHITEEDRTVIVSSLCFDLSYTSLFTALATGAGLYITDKNTYQDPAQLLHYLSQNKITFLKTTPSLFGLMVHSLEFNDVELQLRLVILGGEAIRVQDVEKYHRLYDKTEFINHYGPTETTIGTIAHKIDCKKIKEYELHPVIGRPIDNARIYILDENRKIMPEFVYGKIYVAGKGVGQYINSNIQAQEAFTEHVFFDSTKEKLYDTGDWGRFLPNGCIEFGGRDDDQIKVKGYRIDLMEIKGHLEQNPAISEATVLAKKYDNKMTKLIAYLVFNGKITVGEIRKDLKQSLPEYMLPSEFIEVEKIPLTANNKVDKALLLTQGIKVATSEVFVEPQGELEELVAKVWRKVLNVQQISVTDNFFELGGDSISAVQVKAQLSQYKMELKDIFQYPTIAEISKKLVLNNRTINQGAVCGSIPLTPIQHDFFAQQYKDSNYWNQANLLFASNGFDEQLVEKAFRALVTHHDALRIVFKESHGVITQINKAIDEVDFTVHTYQIEENDIEKAIEQQAKDIQQAMNLEAGPLFNCSIFKTALGDYLLIIIHHLVVDGVSWRILLEDFKTSYNSLMLGNKINLPKKTHSFLDWANYLRDYANSNSVRNQYKYWKNISNLSAPKLPIDFEGENEQRDMQAASMVFNEEETKLITQFAALHYDVKVLDILLSALIFAMKEWSGNNRILVALEGHGRDAVHDELDISRTIGWFTAVYPVLFDLEKIDEPYAQLIQVKAVLDKIPQKGIGYQVLKYLSEDTSIQQDLAINPEISFNYYGRIEENRENEEDIRLSSIELKNTRSDKAKRRYILDVISMIQNGKLILNIGYSQKQYQPASIKKILDILKDNLKCLITNSPVNESRSKAMVKEAVMPFNDVYYHDCLFNAFFPVVNAAGGDIRYILANDISLYQYADDSQRIVSDLFQVESIANILYKNHKILAKVKVHTDNIIDEITKAIDKGNYIVVHVDCYYEDIRTDMYQKSHWTHALLVYGYDAVNNEVYILEHDDVNSLTYSHKVLKYEVLSECVNGYIKNFQKGNHTPLFYEVDISHFENYDSEPDFASIYRSHIRANKNLIQTSIQSLELYIDYYETMIHDEDYIYTHIDFLVKQFNDIVKSKVADDYKFRRLFSTDNKILEISRKIVKNWNFIRAIIQKMKYSNQYYRASFEKTVLKMKEIRMLEKELQDLFK